MSGHSRNPGYQPGQHWVVCDRCGFDYRVRDIKAEWNGLAVCKYCWEPRHIQDFLRAHKEQIKPDGVVRPGVADELRDISDFVDVNAVAGCAIAGVAVAGVGKPNLGPEIPSGTFNNTL